MVRRRGRFGRVGMLVGAVLLAAGPAAVAGDVTPGGAGDFGALLDAPELTRSADDDARRRAAQRRSPQAIRDRRQSRTAHRDMDRKAAIALSRSTFGTTLTGPVWDPLQLGRGDRVDEYIGDRSARVRQSDGEVGIMQGLHPLRRHARNGRVAPVSLDLRERGGAFVSENPLVDVRFGKRAGRAVTLVGGDVAFAPAGVAARTATLAGDRVFYPSVQTDTDFVAMPLAKGVETFWTLRSIDAPEQLELRVGLPAGAVLRARAGDLGRPSPGGAEVMAGAERLASIAEPSAFDADGAPVDVTMRVENGALVLSVPHRSADVAYPVLVDPVITEEYHAVESGDEAGKSHGNLLWWHHNASFEGGTASWVGGEGELGWASHQPLVHGGRHASVRRWPGSGNGWIWYDSARVPIIPGNVYRASHHARAEGSSVPAVFRTEIVFFDQYGHQILHHMGNLVWERADRYWQRSPWATVRAPDHARTALLRMAWETYDGQWHNADMATLEDTTNWSEGTGWWREDSAGQPSAFSGRFAMPMDGEPPYWGPGLYAGTWSGGYYYDNEFALWAWQAPPGAYIQRFKMWNYVHNWDRSRALHGLAYAVPRHPHQWQAYGHDENWVQWNDDTDREYARGHEQDGNMAIFGLQMMGSATRGAATAYMEDATMWLGDVHLPTVSSVSHMDVAPGRWTNATRAGVSVTGRDVGLGIYDMWLEGPSVHGPHLFATFGGCGDRHRRCLNPATAVLGYTPSGQSIPEGNNPVRAKVIDAVDNPAQSTAWNLLIDRSGPKFATPSGSLYSRRTQTTDHRNEGVFGYAHSIRFTASDGTSDPTPSNMSEHRSGTESIHIRIKDSTGAVVIDSPDPEPQTCPESSCGKSRVWTLYSDNLADGSYTVEAEARDQIDNVSTTSFKIYVDRDGDIHGAVGYTGEPEDQGSVIVEESAQVGTSNARETADWGYATQTVVSCAANSAGCAESRSYSPEDDHVTIVRGHSPDDSRVTFSDLLEPASRDQGAASAEGPLLDILSVWQRPPMGNGGRYTRHDEDRMTWVDGERTRLRDSVWMESATKLPIQRATYEGDELVEVQRYSYNLGRRTTAQAGTGYFRPLPYGATSSTTVLGAPAPPSPNQGDQRSDAKKLEDARAYRAGHGFPSDVLTVTPMMADPAQRQNLELFDAPLTAAELTEVERRYAVQNARNVVETFGATVPAFAGSYMNHTAGGLLYVGFTGQVTANLDALKALFPYPERLRGFLATRSLGTLDALQTRVEADDDAGALSFDVATVGRDERANQVAIGTPTVTQAIRDEVAARYGAGARVEAADPIDAAAVYGGVGIDTDTNKGQEDCTLGFAGYREGSGGNNRTRRYHYHMTAGHCIDGHLTKGFEAGYGDFVYEQGRYDSNGEAIPIGRVQGVAYPPPDKTGDSDSAAIYLDPQRNHSTRVYLGYHNGEPLYRKVVGPLNHVGRGDEVCQMGMSTGHRTCGDVVLTNESRKVKNDGRLKPLVKVKMRGKCSVDRGDSGGPVYQKSGKGMLAGGLISAYEDDSSCPAQGESIPGLELRAGHTTYVTPLGLAFKRFKLLLSTSKP